MWGQQQQYLPSMNGISRAEQCNIFSNLKDTDSVYITETQVPGTPGQTSADPWAHQMLHQELILG